MCNDPDVSTAVVREIASFVANPIVRDVLQTIVVTERAIGTRACKKGDR